MKDARKITKIAREAEKLVLLSMRDEHVGTAEIDLIHALRHHPGITQKDLADLLHSDKAAVARRTANLEKKGYLCRKPNPTDGRSQLLYPTREAQGLRNTKAAAEEIFYDYVMDGLEPEKQQVFLELLDVLYHRAKTESRSGFPHVRASLQEDQNETE